MSERADTEAGGATGRPAPDDWLRDFEASARRPLEERLTYSFVKTHKPVLDDAPYRSFESMEEYRRWCGENLPAWLGYSRVAGASSAGEEPAVKSKDAT
jgi:hypothetical protein